MKPKPQRLILNMMVAVDDPVLHVRDAISTCELFGISSNSTRVALARLSAEGQIESCGRGRYQLTAKAHKLVDDLRRWRSALSRIQPWSGRWLAVHSGELGRSDKPVLRRRLRSLELNGFRELARDLYIRPDNLEGGIDAIRQRLYRLGLEEDAPVFTIADLDTTLEGKARGLWQSAELERHYRDTTAQLQRWLDQADTLEPEVAARESFVLGDQAIRQIVFDPLLPATMVDSDARQTFLDTLLQYDRVGHDIWRRLYRENQQA